jgi:class 3 adenylate cyclase
MELEKSRERSKGRWFIAGPKAKISWANVPCISFTDPQGDYPMTADKVKRKITAVLSADGKGYSRLIEANEEAILHTLQESKEMMATSRQHHRGRIVRGAGIIYWRHLPV